MLKNKISQKISQTFANVLSDFNKNKNGEMFAKMSDWNFVRLWQHA